MKRLFFIGSLLTCFNLSFSQASVTVADEQAKNDPKLIELKKNREKAAEDFRKHNSQPSSYYGYDEALKSYFIGNSIPASAPKSDGYASKQEYVKILNQWISSNKNYLKPEHQNIVITE